MARPSATYDARAPGQDVLYRIVRDHFETFRTRADALREGDGLPRFVEQAFREYLRCGWLAGGSRGFGATGAASTGWSRFPARGGRCPSCGGRRMAERAAHLVDHVLPNVPVRQWVLSVAYPLRYLLAWDHDLCRATAAILARSVFRVLADRARDAGVEGTRGGAVVVIQRFGGALNLNVHFHALVLDGVFARGDAADPEFHPTRRLVPRPRVNLILYYGVLGARSAWRPGAPAVTPTAPDAGRPAAAGVCGAAGTDHADTAASRARALQWAALMQRTFGFDVLACPRCAGRLRLVACIEAAGVVRRMLVHLGLPAEVPLPRPARAPPLLGEVHDVRDWHDQPGFGFDT